MLIEFLEKFMAESKKSKISDEKVFILVIYLSKNEIVFVFEC